MNQTKKNPFLPPKNAMEVLKNFDSGLIESTYKDQDLEKYREKEQKPLSSQRQEFTIFNYQEYYEREAVKKQIKELIEQIRKEVFLIKKADASLLSEVKDVEKVVVEGYLPEKPGIYHIRFLEIILRILQTLRAKIGESRTWLQAMISRKKKRGSLFLVLSKKKGTQYSLSQELQTARSVQ